MNITRNLKIGTRLACGFAVVITLLITMAVIGITRIAAVDRNTDVIVNDRYVKIALANLIDDKVNVKMRALRTALIASDPETIKGELAKDASATPVIAEALDKLRASIHSPQGVAALNHVMEVRGPFLEATTHLSELFG